ncbi:hypothetical protein QFC20_007577 [Naganishia adeliensis]|uniref:Uncharacterized protein n=1 Tax=Naganishia adeliensis TaxID=92952 RepID=A0ACC2UXV3_9TREE|nr:hypothetical protein QFC20_007577 [Naganishia adeliensis]
MQQVQQWFQLWPPKSPSTSRDLVKSFSQLSPLLSSHIIKKNADVGVIPVDAESVRLNIPCIYQKVSGNKKRKFGNKKRKRQLNDGAQHDEEGECGAEDAEVIKAKTKPFYSLLVPGTSAQHDAGSSPGKRHADEVDVRSSRIASGLSLPIPDAQPRSLESNPAAVSSQPLRSEHREALQPEPPVLDMSCRAVAPVTTVSGVKEASNVGLANGDTSAPASQAAARPDDVRSEIRAGPLFLAPRMSISQVPSSAHIQPPTIPADNQARPLIHEGRLPYLKAVRRRAFENTSLLSFVQLVPRNIDRIVGGEDDQDKLQTTINNIDVRKWLNGGTLSLAASRLMRTSTRISSFPPGSQPIENKTVFFDADFLEKVDGRWINGSCQISEEDIKPCRPEIQKSITAGSASILVSTNTGGITYNTLQTKHHLALHLLHLERLLSDDDQQPIAVVIDSQNPGNRFHLWDWKSDKRVMTICFFFAIPTIRQVLDRACVMHAVVDANIVTALAVPLGQLIDLTLRTIPFCTERQMDSLDIKVRKQIGDLFNKIGWSLDATKGLEEFLEDMFKRSQKISREDGGRFATQIDCLLRELELEIFFSAIEGTKDELVMKHASLRDLLLRRTKRLPQLLQQSFGMPMVVDGF